MARIENQYRVAVIDARPCPCRLDQIAQHRRHALRFDRRIQRFQRIGGGRGAFSRLQFQQLLGIDGNRVGLHGCRSRDRTSNDASLDEQALDAGVDQPLTELVEIKNARQQNRQRGQIEKDDAPSKRGKEDQPEAVPGSGYRARLWRRTGVAIKRFGAAFTWTGFRVLRGYVTGRTGSIVAAPAFVSRNALRFAAGFLPVWPVVLAFDFHPVSGRLLAAQTSRKRYPTP